MTRRSARELQAWHRLNHSRWEQPRKAVPAWAWWLALACLAPFIAAYL